VQQHVNVRRSGWRLLRAGLVLAFSLALLADAAVASPPLSDNGRPCTIVGTEGNDVLTGTPGEDVVCGLDGDDTLRGGRGRDVLSGGLGNDTHYGEGASDWLYGGSGDDTLRGGTGNDQFVGGPGVDLVAYWGQTKPVRVSIDETTGDGAVGEHDAVGMDIENLSGGKGDDLLAGNAAENRLSGNAGNDRLVGRGGRDRLIGGDGDDLLDSADGVHDSVNCGSGIDRFHRDLIDWRSATCEQASGPLIRALQLSPDVVDYGRVTVGTTASRTVTLTNTGDTPLQISFWGSGPIRPGAGDTLERTSPDTCDVLWWGSECRFELALTPGATGPIGTQFYVGAYYPEADTHRSSNSITVLAEAVEG
jgi:hypothetical protein